MQSCNDNGFLDGGKILLNREMAGYISTKVIHQVKEITKEQTLNK